jgi:hypothetical protein
MADFHIERRHLVPGRDIPELSPEIARKFTSGELDLVRVSPGVEKLRLPRGARCKQLAGEGTEIHLTDRLRVDLSCYARSLNGPEGSTFEGSYLAVDQFSQPVDGVFHGAVAVQNVRLRAYGGGTAASLSVGQEGILGAVYVEGPDARIIGPRSAPGTLRIGMMDPRYTREGNVQVLKPLSDRKIAVQIGPLSGRQHRGPQDPPGEQRHQGRGYKPN